MSPGKGEAAETFDPQPIIRNLSHRPGVYRMLDGTGQVIYVGKAHDLRKRVSSYFQGRAQDTKTMALVALVSDLEVTVTPTETDALMLEYNLIKQHRPRFNVMLRDDKSYPYIHVSTDHPFPRLSFYRGSRKTSGRLFGPYPSAGSVRGTLGQLQKLFQVRQCQDSYFANRTRPCLQHQIHRCTAPCVGLISEQEYGRDVDHAMLFLKGDSDGVSERLAERMETAAEALQFERAAHYRDQIAKLKRVEGQQLVSRSAGELDVIGLAADRSVYAVTVMFVRGGRILGSRNHFPKVSPGSTVDEVIRAFILQYYSAHEAPPEILTSHPVPESELLEEMLTERMQRQVRLKNRVRGDRTRLVEMAVTNAGQAVAIRLRSNATITQQLEAIADALGLDEAPSRLECFDISHTGGEATVASCVVFSPEGPVKSDYRRFNIKGVEPGDDYGAMEQALTRRYKRLQQGEARLPDVLLIDGGAGQLGRAQQALAELGVEGVSLVGVAKGQGRKAGRERLYQLGIKGSLSLPANSPALHLIQQLRDEAHRFAITGHRAQRQKARTRSPLEDIPGLGPKRRRAVLRQFGGLQAVARAGVDDLARVKGISRNLAQSIYSRFHADD